MENARLNLDAVKAKAKNAGGRGMNPDDEHVSEELRAQIERKEDEFVNKTEEAVEIMKNVRSLSTMSNTPSPSIQTLP